MSVACLTNLGKVASELQRQTWDTWRFYTEEPTILWAVLKIPQNLVFGLFPVPVLYLGSPLPPSWLKGLGNETF